jgi:hypothetical protein
MTLIKSFRTLTAANGPVTKGQLHILQIGHLRLASQSNIHDPGDPHLLRPPLRLRKKGIHAFGLNFANRSLVLGFSFADKSEFAAKSWPSLQK